jgi:hypothetical protein
MQPHDGRLPVSAKNLVMSCDLQVLVQKAAEPVPMSLIIADAVG